MAAGDEPENVGSQRLLAAAAKGELHDRALWTPLAAASGAGGNPAALVGTPETVAQAILDYIDIGVTTILIRGPGSPHLWLEEDLPADASVDITQALSVSI